MDRRRSEDAGALLRGYRREAGLTQRQLADAAGVSIGVVRDLEQRRTAGLHPDSVWRLAKVLRLGLHQALRSWRRRRSRFLRLGWGGSRR